MTEWAKTACILCECNCGLEMQVADRRLLKIRGDKDHPGSAGYTCEKPLRLDRYQNGPHRLDSPLRRRPDGTYEEIDWDTALDEIAGKLAAVRDTHGGDKIFYYGGGGQGNHLGGAYGRALMAALGVKYFSNALAQEKTSEAWVTHEMCGTHVTGDFENAEVAVFIGKNPWQSHGVARARPTLRELARDPKRSIIVIDPRRSETAELADFHLQLKPGTDLWCVSAIAATLVQENLIARDWLDEHAVGVEDVLAFLRRVDITDHAGRCDVPEDLIRAAARRIAAAESVSTYEDLGVQHSSNSTLVAYMHKMLWLLTGNFGKPGGVNLHSWVVPIAGRWHAVPRQDGPVWAEGARRVIGTKMMRHSAKLLRRLLSGSSGRAWSRAMADRAADAALRVFFEPLSVPLAQRLTDRLTFVDSDELGTTPVTGAAAIGGLIPCNSIVEEILTDHPDRLRAMWIDASNPVHSLPGTARFAEAMRSLAVSVVVDVAFTETARQADYVLPAASQFEKYEASFFTLHFPHNTFQVRRPLMDPLPGTRPEPEIYAAIVDRLGLVDQRLIDDLTAAATVSHRAFALALFSTVEHQPELAGLLPYLLYRTLGTTMPDGERPMALVWGMAQVCAIGYPDAVGRAGFTARGFAKGEQLFEAFRDNREGVLFSDDSYEDAWSYVRHPDRKIHASIPLLLDELKRLNEIESDHTSAEFPFVLSAGERRAFTANVIIRNPEWRRRDAEGALRIGEDDAADLGVTTGDRVRVVTEAGAAETVVEVNAMMRPGHVSLPNGLGVTYPGEDGTATVVGVPLNTLTTNSRRDKFFGNPNHKNVPARIEVLR
ncbi:molybdopterin oxidoreductase [Actinosynnema sp. ALI-1.44]|uniref:molybdopterin-dependent oxidoreductase n=1 Tax=Actinosynnema sp. ALI-1.44 TaxID=1933779 RepID=UPI00097BCD9C|nr:molybdopterin-dependent oxidoreductase [Actinosynnema sp. ALI-1.44]ONI70265.1 molybdopterin oxidoreductase [Actinosynnema sp. ALI-1.44]